MRLSLNIVIRASVLPLVLSASFSRGGDVAYFADGEVLAMNQVQITDTPDAPMDTTTFKLAVPLRETPRSITVITAERIQEQNFRKLEDTFRYVPGIFSRSQDVDSYHFSSRGFDMGADETKIDGFTGLIANGTLTPSLFGVEQVVYLRGPSGLQYGASATPGGVINLITKKAQFTGAFTRTDIRFGTYQGSGLSVGDNPSYEASLDTNVVVGKEAKFAYRINAQAQNLASYKDEILDRQRGLLATATWRFGADDRFTLTPLFEYQKQPFGAGRGTSVSPHTSLSLSDGKTGPIQTDDLSPLRINLAFGFRTLTNEIAGIDFSATLTPAWKTKIGYRYIRTDSDSNQFTPQATTLRQLSPTDPFSWVIDRRQAKSQTNRHNHAFDIQTTYEKQLTDGVKNLSQLGFNGRFFRTTLSRSSATQKDQSPINIYTGQAVTPLVDVRPTWVDAFLNDDFYWNAYFQNQTSIHDRWIATVGLGYGEQHYGRDYPAGQTPPANLAQLVATRKGDLTPNASLVYNLSKTTSLYTSYSTSFSPAPGDYEDARGQTGNFGPTTGENLEAGAKIEAPKLHLAGTVSVFQTELDNVLVQSATNELNPRGNRYYTQTGGGRRTRGVEFSSEARPLPGWRVQATASYLDSRYQGEGRIVGARTERTPPWAFSFYNRYDFSAAPLKGLGASLGLIWQDQRWSAAATPAAPDPLVMPSYTRIDCGLFYRLGLHWDFAVNCENAFNKQYFVNGTTGAALEVGAPRSLSFRAGYRF